MSTREQEFVTLFDDVDPTGIYKNFVQNAFYGFNDSSRVEGDNILYVYGYGNNGKTTLIKCIERAFPKKILNVTAEFLQDNETVIDGVCLLNLSEDVYILDERVQIINMYFSQHNNLGLIINSNSMPPEGLKCTLLHCRNTFNGRSNFDEERCIDPIKESINIRDRFKTTKKAVVY